MRYTGRYLEKSMIFVLLYIYMFCKLLRLVYSLVLWRREFLIRCYIRVGVLGPSASRRPNYARQVGPIHLQFPELVTIVEALDTLVVREQNLLF